MPWTCPEHQAFPGSPMQCSNINAVNIKDRRCLCGMSMSPSFGLPGEPKSAARWCSKCPEKPPSAVDIKSRRCLLREQHHTLLWASWGAKVCSKMVLQVP